MTKLICVFILLTSWSSHAQSFNKLSNPSSCKSQILAKNKSTTSLSANFKETTYSSMFNNPKIANGKLNYKASNKIRWEHASPKNSVVLINEGTIRMSENGKEVKNATSNMIAKKIQALMLQMLNGDFVHEKDFKVNYYHNTSTYKLILTPKSSRMSKYISKIELFINKKTMALDEMKMIETQEDKVVYLFSSVRFNEKISDTKFNQF